VRAHEIMTTDVATVHADTTIRVAADRLAARGITSMPVLDDDERIVGIVSEADLIRDRLPQDPRSHLRLDARDERDPARFVHEVMQEPVICLGPNADTADLAALMLDHDIRAVPIVDGATVVGMVSRRDLLRTLLRDDALIAADIRARLADYSTDSRRWSITVVDGVATVRGRFTDDRQRDSVIALARTVPGVLRVHGEQRRTRHLRIS
jgi:CBS domain-containing protein